MTKLRTSKYHSKLDSYALRGSKQEKVLIKSIRAKVYVTS